MPKNRLESSFSGNFTHSGKVLPATERFAFVCGVRFLFFLIPTADSRLSRRESCDRHVERGAGDICKSRVMAEFHRAGISAVFTADAKLDVGSGRLYNIFLPMEHRLQYSEYDMRSYLAALRSL